MTEYCPKIRLQVEQRAISASWSYFFHNNSAFRSTRISIKAFQDETFDQYILIIGESQTPLYDLIRRDASANSTDSFDSFCLLFV